MESCLGLIFVACLLSSCAPAEPVPIADCGPAASSTRLVHACYGFERGTFRSLLWPGPQSRVFTAVMVDRSGDHHFAVEAPPTNVTWGRNTFEASAISVVPHPTILSMDIHSFKGVDGSLISLNLPRSQVSYTFQFHDVKPSSGGLTFMKLTERVDERGVFGFVSWDNGLPKALEWRSAE